MLTTMQEANSWFPMYGRSPGSLTTAMATCASPIPLSFPSASNNRRFTTLAGKEEMFFCRSYASRCFRLQA